MHVIGRRCCDNLPAWCQRNNGFMVQAKNRKNPWHYFENQNNHHYYWKQNKAKLLCISPQCFLQRLSAGAWANADTQTTKRWIRRWLERIYTEGGNYVILLSTYCHLLFLLLKCTHFWGFILSRIILYTARYFLYYKAFNVCLKDVTLMIFF